MEGKGSVVIIGSGIGGIQASLDLADAGFKVYLVEESPSIGGIMAQLDKTFPTNDCSMCIISPKLVECSRHLNIELLTYSEVSSVSGGPGNFSVKIRKKARYVDEDLCTGCMDCEEVCPVVLKNEFDGDLSSRKAIYRPFPQASPNIFTIEKSGDPPCRTACPAGCNAQGYVALIGAGKYAEALELIRERIPLPGICGRVCGYCEDYCNRGIFDEPVRIRALKRFASDYEIKNGAATPVEPAEQNKDKVAIIGSGPSGLTAAYDLAKEGYRPVVFEAMASAGGMLRYGIPDYRLPADILDYEIDVIKKAGVEIKTGTPVSSKHNLESLLKDGYKAVFVGVGTQAGYSLNIKGEDQPGVITGVDFLRQFHTNKLKTDVKGKTVAVIGGGNTAMDAVRTAVRLGAKKAFILYRRTKEQMPVNSEERKAVEKEGIPIHFLYSPVEIVPNGTGVDKVVCSKMRLGYPDTSGRRRPVPVPGETKAFKADVVITAIGQQIDLEALVGGMKDLVIEKNIIKTDPVTLQTSLPGVFAGGDAIGGAGLVVHAIAHGHRAAESIRLFCEGKDLVKDRKDRFLKKADMPGRPADKENAVKLPELSAKKRTGSFDEVEQSLSEKDAVAEAKRCLDCGICSECLQCVSVCKAKAIDHTMQEQEIEVNAGAVIIATGCDRTDAEDFYVLGYGKFSDVVTSVQFERILSASGPYGGHIQCPSDGRKPKKIAFIQCVGSRDVYSKHEHCSSVCCMYAIKEAIIAKEHEPDIQPTIFYMDIRAFGKDFDKYYQRAQDQYGIVFKKARASNVTENSSGRGLTLQYEDESGKVCMENFDLVILSIGFQGHGRLRKIADRVGVPLNQYGFIASSPAIPVQTKVPGIFVCGPAQEPKDIPETVTQGSAAAAAAAEILAAHRFTEVKEKEYPGERDVSVEKLSIGIFICRCGINIGGTVDVPDVVEYAKTLDDVVYAEENLYTCSQDTQDHIKSKIKEHSLNRIIVASCSPRTHEPLFQETIREAGLNKHLFEMANIRDQCSWIHMGMKEEATRKAKDLIRMAAAKIRLVESLPRIPIKVNQNAIVIGGGPAGMSAALSLAGQGFPVELIEKTDSLGGNLKHIFVSPDKGNNPQSLLHMLVGQIEANEKINVRLNTQIKSVEGYLGNYKTLVANSKGNEEELVHGAAVIAVGGNESVPEEYLYGKEGGVKTQTEFEKMLAGAKPEEFPSRAVFIQCVGSREEGHMYCSRICCMVSVKQAIILKQRKPEAEVFVLYRDIRTYGFFESMYKQARAMGVIFLKYDPDKKPLVSKNGGSLAVAMTDVNSGENISINTDAVVLAARIDPPVDNEGLSQAFKVPLNQEGYFLEAHVKLRPVDFATDGVYVAGMAHCPKTIPESIAQGKASAGRAATVICKEEYEAEATIAAVNEDLCDGCGVCIGVCEYKALEIEETADGKKIAKLAEASCKGCGCCVAACPSGAMEQKGFKDEQIKAVIDAALI